MKPQNILYIMSDEHNAKMMGCYGHNQVKTPNLDKLALRGTRFNAHYTNSPICIPARAAFATGRYTHETGYWDNAMPYDGAIKGWGHRLQDEGIRVEAIGKLHYRSKDLNTGFSKQYQPMHVMDGIGQVWGSVRDPLPDHHHSRMLKEIGPGDSGYNHYDRSIADEACTWLKKASNQPDDKPWLLYLGFVAPHFPLVVPEEFYNMYPLDQLPRRKLDPADGFPRHPWLQRMDDFHPVDSLLTPEEKLRAVAAYFGLCSFVDTQIGRVLDALNESGLEAETRVLYTSDHGDNVGARAMWGKSNLYEESARIPLIIAGDGIPEGTCCNTATSLLDTYQTVLAGVGLNLTEEEMKLPGGSWFDFAKKEEIPDRSIFSEYHAIGSPTGAFMLRKGRYKFIYYVDYEPELFNISDDPEEMTNLAGQPEYANIVAEYETNLREICNPEKVDRQAKEAQNNLIKEFGGRIAALNTGTPGATPVPGGRHE